MTASRRVLVEWSNRVRAEYASAALTAQALHWMTIAAFPDELLRTALRIVGDELDHARLSHDCLTALGGQDEPMTLDIANLSMPQVADGPLASLLDSVLRNFCFGETFAVPLFNAMREHTTHPACQPALTRILRDEAVHRAFGWDALDVLLDIDRDGVVSRTHARLPRIMGNFHRAYGEAPVGHPLSDDERSMGLLDGERYREIHAVTLDQDIRRRFDKRGITLPDVSIA